MLFTCFNVPAKVSILVWSRQVFSHSLFRAPGWKEGGGGGGGTGGTHLTFTIVSQNKKFEQNLPPDYLSKVQHYLEIPCYCADRW